MPKEKSVIEGKLNEGVDSWNEWRSNSNNSGLFMQDFDLSNRNLRGFNLSNAKFTNANMVKTVFSHANLDNSVFADAYMLEAVLINSKLKNANFHRTDLRRSYLERAEVEGGDFREANLFRAKMQGGFYKNANFMSADMRRTNLEGANLENTKLYMTNLRASNLRNAKLRGASLMMANLTGVDFTGADLRDTNLQGAQMIGANLTGANLDGAKVFGISAWDLTLKNTIQTNLVITRQSKFTDRFLPTPSIVTADNLEVSQFVYLLLNNPKIRAVIDTVTSKVVLILGRFSSDRKEVLDLIKSEIRKNDLIPVMFDFDKSDNRDLTETVSALAHLSKFIIADLTEPQSVPHELAKIIPALPSVDVHPIIRAGDEPYSMFGDLARLPWVKPVLKYEGLNDIEEIVMTKIIASRN